jgi:hypothetical protein
MQIDFEKIGLDAWDKLKKTSEFTSGMTPKTVLVFEPIVVGFPRIAGEEILNAKADLRGVFNAKISFIEYAIKQDFVSKFAEAAGLGSDLFDFLNSAMSEFIEIFSKIAKDVPSFLEDQGISEADSLSMIGYDDKLMKKLEKGMTIADLYQSNPMIIVKNTD